MDINVPMLYLHANKENSALNLVDFLSNTKENKYFTEEYVKNLLIESKLFPSSLIVNHQQSNGEPDIIDPNGTAKYEVKTIWGQAGCKLLSLQQKIKNKTIERALLDLQLYNNLEMYFNSAIQLINLPKEIVSLTEKMSRKQTCDYVLFYPFSFSIDDVEVFPATDIDAVLWKNILIKNDFNFSVYVIKPTYWRKFVIIKINKNHIKQNVFFKYDDFFQNYVSII